MSSPTPILTLEQKLLDELQGRLDLGNRMDRRFLQMSVADMGKLLALARQGLKLEADVRQLRSAVYAFVTECLEAEVREDAPEFINGEVEAGMAVLPPCGACAATGSTDRKNYEDTPIPPALVCPSCGGWGFLQEERPAAAGAA